MWSFWWFHLEHLVTFLLTNFILHICDQTITQAAQCQSWCWIFPGNKNDRSNQREIPQYVGEDFGRRHDMKFIETSAKEADNVEALFHDIARELIRQVRANEMEPPLTTDFAEISNGGSTQIYTTVTECCSAQPFRR